MLSWRTQNLDQRPGDGWEASGSKLLHGRGWLSRRNSVDHFLGVEWVLRSWSLGMRLVIGDAEREVSGHVAFPPVSLYFHVPCPDWLDRLFNRGHHSGREFDLSFHSAALWWKFFARDGEWNCADPWWKSGCIRFRDLLQGRVKHSEDKVLETREVLIPMPEGVYNATVVMKLESWKRRLGRRKRVVRAHVDVPDGIPFPGKGENAWDCGPDATYGLSCTARDPEEAIAALVESTLRTRQQRCGSHIYTDREDAAQ